MYYWTVIGQVVEQKTCNDIRNDIDDFIQARLLEVLDWFGSAGGYGVQTALYVSVGWL